MSLTSITLSWTQDLKFTGRTTGGFETRIDANSASDTNPVELLLMSIASCSASDVVSILEKMRTPVSRMEIGVEADRNPSQPRYLTHTNMRFDLWGEGLRPEKAARAIFLSIVRYCSVFNSLRSDMTTEVAFRIHAPDAEPIGTYTPVSLDPSAIDNSSRDS